MSDPWTRMLFQQMLNAAMVGDLVPLGRAAAINTGVDPETGDVMHDPTFSEALYYAVDCADYAAVPPGSTGRRQLDVWLDTAAATGIDGLRTGDPFYTDLMCLFWPDAGAPAARPAPVTDPPYPLLLLTADTDPNTPPEGAARIFHRTLGEAALVVQQGGPHVLYGRGDPCVDHVVTDLITTGRLPGSAVTTCHGALTEPYWINPPARAAGYVDGYGTARAVLGSVLTNASYQSWTARGRMDIGCDAGGVAEYRIDEDDVVQVTLDGCAWTTGVPVDGRVSVTEAGTGDVTADFSLPFAELSVDEDWDVSGTFRGRPVS
jgi:hypothetical protein